MDFTPVIAVLLGQFWYLLPLLLITPLNSADFPRHSQILKLRSFRMGYAQAAIIPFRSTTP